jgi:hypothetical protein
VVFSGVFFIAMVKWYFTWCFNSELYGAFQGACGALHGVAIVTFVAFSMVFYIVTFWFPWWFHSEVPTEFVRVFSRSWFNSAYVGTQKVCPQFTGHDPKIFFCAQLWQTANLSAYEGSLNAAKTKLVTEKPRINSDFDYNLDYTTPSGFTRIQAYLIL